MKSKFDNIRYGSAIFMYISSSFIITNIILTKCSDIYAFSSFIVTSVIVVALLFCDKASQNPGKLTSVFIGAAIVCSVIYELSRILSVFSVSSDNASTKAGTYVFAFIIVYTAYLCSHFGADALIKLSNIIFVIPLISLIVSAFGIISTGLSTDILAFTSSNILLSLSGGVTCSLLFLSDIYIIIYMLKKEKCYKCRISIGSFAFSLCFILLIAVIYRMTFGIEISQKLYAPAISAAGLIRGFDFEEIYLFAYSVCLLFRAACRIYILSDMIKRLVPPKMASNICLNIFLIFISIISAYMKNGGLSEINFDLSLSILSALAFIILPIFVNKNAKEQLNKPYTTK